MNYGRDYGNRNFLERAANTVRGWVGRRGGGDDRWYDDEYRGGMMNRGWDDDRGYREMGDVSGYRGGATGGGYGGANWRGYNDDWNRGMGGGWGRGGGEEYRTGGYNARHGGWDVDGDDNRTGGYDRGMNRGGYGGGERDHYMGRDFMTNHPHFGHDWRSGHSDDATVDMNRGGEWNRGGLGGGMMGRGMDRGWDEDRTLNRGYGANGRYGADYGGGMNRGQGGNGRYGAEYGGGMDRGGMGGSYGGGGMLSRDASVGDVNGGMIGNYGAYGNYGIERFRSGSAGGVPTGQHFTGYGVGSGYRG